MISSSRMGGAEDSFYGTLKAAELGYTKALQSKTDLKGDTCDLSKASGDKVTCTNGTVIAFTGKVPEKGTLVIDSSGSILAKEVTLNGYKCYGDLSTKNPCVKTSIEVAGETLIAKKVTTGDGLYGDTYEKGRYIFRGDNPNNYLTFNNEIWRIISVEDTGVIKVIRNEVIGNKAYDSSNYRSQIKNTYCISPENMGCSVWSKVDGIYSDGVFKGTVTEDSELNTYLNTNYYHSLSLISQNNILNYKFKTGTFIKEADYGLNNSIEEENSKLWTGKVGLINPTEFMRASTNLECTTAFVAGNSPYPCGNNNYLFDSKYDWWTINQRVKVGVDTYITYGIYAIGHDGAIGSGPAYANSLAARPVTHLKPNIEFTGLGTKSNPYIIK